MGLVSQFGTSHAASVSQLGDGNTATITQSDGFGGGGLLSVPGGTPLAQ
jgi:hypothetical protein